MRYLFTGSSGFVAKHYFEYLFSQKQKLEIAGVDTRLLKHDFLENKAQKKIKFYCGSLLDKKWLESLIKKVNPHYIVHLASYSSVAYSWKEPVKCFLNNTNIFLNLVDSIRKLKIKTKILSVGSSEEYGIVSKKAVPIRETVSLNPVSPYAVARVSQEELSRVYKDGYNIPIVLTRSFNHIGPEQKDIFVVSSFAKQVVEVKKGKRNRIVCGNLNIIRDFIDVRDVVKAYDSLLKRGKIGETYNVCSGKGYKLSQILEMLMKKANVKVPVKIDAKPVRPADNPIIVGSPAKLKRHTGFKRKYTLSKSLDDILAYWEKHV